MRYNIIAWTEITGAEEIESFGTLEEARNHLKEISAPDCLDPYYRDLVEDGGYLKIEDSNGGGY